MGDRWQLVPVFWGDLGADDRWVARTIPNPGQIRPVAPEMRDVGQVNVRVTPDERAVLAWALAVFRGPLQWSETPRGVPCSGCNCGRADPAHRQRRGHVEIRDGDTSRSCRPRRHLLRMSRTCEPCPHPSRDPCSPVRRRVGNYRGRIASAFTPSCDWLWLGLTKDLPEGQCDLGEVPVGGMCP